MAITALTDPSELPNQNDDQLTFDLKIAKMIANYPLRAQQENDLAAGMNAIAAGGAYAIPYVFTSGTADTDPTPGKLALDSATQNAAGMLRLDLIAGGQDYTGVIDSFDDSTSTIKGTIRLVKMGDASKWLMFNVTGLASPTGYRNVGVTCIGGSSATPFTSGDGVMLYFQRTGDLASATPPQYMKVSERQPSGTTGGTSVTAGYQTRVLNTVEVNTITGASLSANSVTLPSGTYKFKGRAPAQLTFHKALLNNTTDATFPGNGSNASTGSGTGGPISDSVFSGQFTIAASKSFSIRHYTVTGNATTGLGAAISIAGQLEVFSELEFERIS